METYQLELNIKEMRSIFERLTKREIEVVTVLSKGFSYKKTAKELHISHSTVSNYLCKIKIKTNLKPLNIIRMVIYRDILIELGLFIP